MDLMRITTPVIPWAHVGISLLVFARFSSHETFCSLEAKRCTLQYSTSRPASSLGYQILHGHRVTSATSYLAQAINRKNLDVVVNTRVTKVFPVGTEDGKPVFRGVEFAQTADGSYSESPSALCSYSSSPSRSSPYLDCL